MKEFNQQDYPGLTRDEAIDAYLSKTQIPIWIIIMTIFALIIFLWLMN